MPPLEAVDLVSRWDILPAMVLVFDRDGRIVLVNESLARTVGRPPADLEGLDVSDLVDPAPSVDPQMRETPGWAGSVDLRRADGAILHCQVITGVREIDGRPHGVMVGLPVSALSGNERDRWLASIIDSTEDAVFSKGLDGIIRTWNRGAERMYGYTADEVVGRHVSILGPPEKLQEFRDFLEEIHAGRQVKGVETVRQAKDGSLFDVSVTVSPMYDEKGVLVAASTIARDISRRKEAERHLQESQDQLDIITAGVADGITIQDARGRLVYANRAAAAASGFDSPDAMIGADPLEMARRFLIFDEQGEPMPWDELPGRRALAGQPGGEVTVRSVDTTTGAETWQTISAAPVLDPNGTVRFAVNIFRDITTLRRSEAALRLRTSILEAEAEASAEGVVVVTPAGEVTSVNSRFLVLWGLTEPPGDEPAFTALLLSGVGDATQLETLLGSVGRDPQRASEITLPLADGRVLRLLTKPLNAEGGEFLGRIWFFRDITEERREIARHRFLLEASRLLASSLEYERTLSRVTELAVPVLADWCVIDMVSPSGEIETLALSHRSEDKVRQARWLRERLPVSLSDPTGVAAVIRTGRTEMYPIVEALLEDALAEQADEELRDVIRSLDLGSLIIAPLTARGRTFGAITFAREGRKDRFDEDDLTLAEDLAARAALAIDNARSYRERDEIAAVLQRSLLPPALPEIPGVEAAARYVAAGAATEVGGDFYDVFSLDGSAWSLVIGDVCGRGTKAATLTGLARHTLRAASMGSTVPSAALATLNRAILDEGGDRFCTACFVRMLPSPDGARLTVSAGGHPLPIVVRASGALEVLGRYGTLIGVVEEPSFFDIAGDLGPGDAVVLYTDGVTDSQHDGEEFGEERLMALLADCVGDPAEAIADRIRSAVLTFADDRTIDDVAILIAKVPS